MTTARTAFLRRVREAAAGGNRPGQAVAVEPRGTIGYQGADPDPATRFCEEFTAAGGKAHLVPDREAAVAGILEIARLLAARRILLGRGSFLDSLNLAERLKSSAVTPLSPALREEGSEVKGQSSSVAVDTQSSTGTEILISDAFAPGSGRDALFAADLGITGVDYLIAETGSVVLLTKSGEPRSLSLLPPVHIAVAERPQLVPDLFDLFESKLQQERTDMPSCVSLITGPSKTGDIELRLVTGVHGPGEIHVFLVNN